MVSVKMNVMRSVLLMQGEVMMGNEENSGSMRGGETPMRCEECERKNPLASLGSSVWPPLSPQIACKFFYVWSPT